MEARAAPLPHGECAAAGSRTYGARRGLPLAPLLSAPTFMAPSARPGAGPVDDKDVWLLCDANSDCVEACEEGLECSRSAASGADEDAADEATALGFEAISPSPSWADIAEVREETHALMARFFGPTSPSAASAAGDLPPASGTEGDAAAAAAAAAAAPGRLAVRLVVYERREPQQGGGPPRIQLMLVAPDNTAAAASEVRVGHRGSGPPGHQRAGTAF
jgi:hypothetical protein